MSKTTVRGGELILLFEKFHENYYFKLLMIR